MDAPSRDVALYGTAQAVDAPRVLRAGALTAELEAGNLRYIRWHGEEVLRAISFIVRDRDWGTYDPAISDLEVEEGENGFRVSLHAEVDDGEQRFAYDARIEGTPDGRLTFHGKGETPDGFLTNRTGFVILHPIAGVSGEPVIIRHTVGTEVEGRFPAIIDPVQPMMDLRALTHTTPGGVRVETVMEGDTYEMEDQRNWTDASYKTYVRPLAKPWPYRIEPGETIDQTITVTLAGEARSTASGGPVSMAVGEAAGDLPPLGIGLRPEDATAALDAIEPLKRMAPAYLVLHHDPRSGHDRSTLERMLAVAKALDAECWLEAVIASTDDEGAAREVEALGGVAEALGHPFATVLVSPAPDLKCTLPGSDWPPAPDARTLYDAARRAFPAARIGGGMFSYFTELNRKRPPMEALDLVSFTTSPVVHAGDDRSVMETHEAHPAIVASVKGIAQGRPWAVGPSAIGVRDNPYGESAKINPDNIRQAMNWNDPRQRGLLGAAWNLGYFADFALGGASAVALGAATGPFGAVFAEAAFSQPWFDGRGGVYPVFHILRGLARLRGRKMRRVEFSPAGELAGLAVETDGETEVWIANTGPEPVRVDPGQDPVSLAVLDATCFAAAAQDEAFMDATINHEGPIELDAFAIARVRLGAG